MIPYLLSYSAMNLWFVPGEGFSLIPLSMFDLILIISKGSLFFVSKLKGGLRLVNSRNNTPRLYISAFRLRDMDVFEFRTNVVFAQKNWDPCKVLHLVLYGLILLDMNIQSPLFLLYLCLLRYYLDAKKRCVN